VPAGRDGDGVDLAAWRDGFEAMFGRVAGLFSRAEPRRTARSMLLGLLSTVERKNCWWLAEQVGASSPDAMQRLLSAAVWDADQACQQLRGYVVAHLGHRDAVLVVDETGYLKKGR
jgi:SRSO17 transposase